MRCRNLTLFGILFCGAATFLQPSTASAWEAGTYGGTSADGQNFSFVVGQADDGALQIQSVNLGITATCNPGGTTFMTGWGLGGNGTDLTKANTTYVFNGPYLYLTVAIAFKAGNPATATGTLTSYTPTFAPLANGSTSHPKKAIFCTSAKQSFTTSLLTSDVASASAKSVATGVVYGVMKAGK
jgi:hypothetical protein